MPDLENKRVFLLVSSNEEKLQHLEKLIKKHVQNTTIFTATDGVDALFKTENVPPNVVIADIQLPKLSGIDLTEKLLQKKDRMAVVIVSPIPDKEHFVDEMVTGQVQFLTLATDENKVSRALARALNWVSNGDDSSYHIRFLAPDELLIKEGEKAESVFLVKKGRLKAYKADPAEVELGTINAGEFVGEMAYINGEPRSANVKSITDCELIEIPNKSLDVVLFSKPAWSKALVRTLSLRLKSSNEEKASNKTTT